MSNFKEIKTPYGTLYQTTKPDYDGWIKIRASGNGIETRNKRFRIKLPHKIILLVQKFLLWRAKKTNTQYIGVLFVPWTIQETVPIITGYKDEMQHAVVNPNMWHGITLDAELTEKGKEVFDDLKKNSSLE